MDRQVNTHISARGLWPPMADTSPYPTEPCWWRASLRAWTSPMPPQATPPLARPGWGCLPGPTAAWTLPPSTGPSPTMTPTLRSPLRSRYLATWALAHSLGTVGGIRGGAEGDSPTGGRGDRWVCLTVGWMQVFGSFYPHMALWTGGVCHGHPESSECQGVGLVTRD